MVAARYFVIKNDTITNAIIYEASDDYDAGEATLRLASRMPEGADIGWRKISGTWQAPEPVVPTVPASVTPRQLRLALLGAGKLAQVEAFVTGGQAPPEAVISWQFATEFLRSDPMLSQFAAMLGLSGQEVDALFIAAAQIQ